jgi:hypothetical protein
MNYATGFSREDIVDLCVMICAEREVGKRPWPPILGLYKSVVIALTYMRRNRVQAELAETFGVSQPTISRAVSAITPLLGATLADHVPTADDLDENSQYIVDGSLLPCWSWASHPKLYSGCEDGGAASCSWPDPYSGWPQCLVLDLSATGVRW